MALNFPASPVDGQVYYDPVTNSKYVYVAASTKWKSMQYTAVNVFTGFQQANVAFATANAAYNSANSDWNVQNTIFDLANTIYAAENSNWTVQNSVYSLANTIYGSSNSNYTLSNTSYASINSNWVVTNALYSVANSAYGAANNVGPQIAPTYNTANAAFIHANAAYNASNSDYAATNAAYNQANAAYSGSNSNYVTTNAAYNQANAAYNGSNSNYVTTNAAYNFANTRFSSSGGTISGAVEITADLTVHGNTTFVDQRTLKVGDPLIYLAANNYSSDVVDIGFVANYVNSTSSNVHTGLFRSSGTKEYYLFYGYDQEPDNNYINPTGNNIQMAVLNSTVRTSNLILGGANAINWITSDYVTTNSAYSTVNAAYGFANSAYASINSNWTVTNALYSVANAAYGSSNTAYSHTYGIANGTVSINNISLTGTINPGTVNFASQTLTDGATINWDIASGAVATVTLGGNRTMAAPSNLKVGTFILHVIQDGSGSRTITWNSVFKWPGAVAPVLTTTANRHDVISFVSDGTNLYGSYLPDVR